MSTVQRQPFEPDDTMMRAWLQQERRHPGFLPDKIFRDNGKVLTFRVKSIQDAKRHATFSYEHGVKSHSHAQFARNTMYQAALIETRGNMRAAADILKVSPGAICQARLAMKLGAEFQRDPNSKFEDEDVIAMSPMPEIRLSNGPQTMFDRYSKFYPEAINKARNLYGFELSDTAVFLLMDLGTRSRPDKPHKTGKALPWAFHIFTDPQDWLAHTGLSRSQFYRALKQLREAGLIFKHGQRHWVISYQGPTFKWLCQQGFAVWESLANKEYTEVMEPAMVDDAVGAYAVLADYREYRPMLMKAKVQDYFEYVFASVRQTLRVVRDVAVQVYSRTKKLLEFVGLGGRGLYHDAAYADPDPPDDHAATFSGGSKEMKSSLSTV